MPRPLPVHPFILLLLLSGASGVADAAEDGPLAPEHLAELSLEELLEVDVDIAAKRPQPLAETASAVFLIPGETIYNIGARTLADALRIAPGLHVAKVSANQYAVSSRGLNDLFATKMLVLMDGRSLYTPLFSGTFWDVTDTFLPDVDRIEVVRGPGATLWGANAVNGVINIMTRPAGETQGWLANLGIGTERAFAGVRYGDAAGDNGHYRVYLKAFERNAAARPDGSEAFDDWRMLRAGFRGDWDTSERDALTVQGAAYLGEVGNQLQRPLLNPPYVEPVTADNPVSGGYLRTRWQRRFSARRNAEVRISYERAERKAAGVAEVCRDTGDLEYKQRWGTGNHDIVWGLRTRVSSDDTRSLGTVSFTPSDRTAWLYSGYISDTWSPPGDRVRVRIGTKVEHNDFSGLEVQPSAGVSYDWKEGLTVWASTARAVRTPGRVDHDVRIEQSVLPPGAVFPGSPPALVVVNGDEGFDAQALWSFDCGIRGTPNDALSYDVTGFYHYHDGGRTFEPEAPIPVTGPPVFLILPFRTDNLREIEIYGAEAALGLQPCRALRLSLAYTHLRLDVTPEPTSEDATAEQSSQKNPRNMFSLHSRLIMSEHLTADAVVRYVDSIPNYDVPSYLVLDTRLAWRPRPGLELSVVGRNLLDDRHPEYGTSGPIYTATEVEQEVWAQVLWRF